MMYVCSGFFLIVRRFFFVGPQRRLSARSEAGLLKQRSLELEVSNWKTNKKKFWTNKVRDERKDCFGWNFYLVPGSFPEKKNEEHASANWFSIRNASTFLKP